MGKVNELLQDLLLGIVIPLILTVVELLANALATHSQPLDQALVDEETNEQVAERRWFEPLRKRFWDWADGGITLCVGAIGADFGAVAITRTTTFTISVAILSHVALLLFAALVERAWLDYAISYTRRGRIEQAKLTNKRRVIIVNVIGLLSLFSAFIIASRLSHCSVITIALVIGLGFVVYHLFCKDGLHRPSGP